MKKGGSGPPFLFGCSYLRQMPYSMSKETPCASGSSLE